MKTFTLTRNVLQWNVASVLIDPIITPFFSYLNLTIGMLFTTIFFVFPFFFKNVWNTAYFDINSSSVFDNTGSDYSTSEFFYVRSVLM